MSVDDPAMTGQQDHFLLYVGVLSYFAGKQVANFGVGDGVRQAFFGFPGNDLFEFLFRKLRQANVLHEQFFGPQTTHNPATFETMIGNQFPQSLSCFAVLFLRRQSVVSRHFSLCQSIDFKLTRRTVKLHQGGRARVQMQPDGMCRFAFECNHGRIFRFPHE